MASFLHRLALARFLAPEIDAFLIGGYAAADRLGEQVLDHGVDFARLQRLTDRRHVFAQVLAAHAVAALVGIGELVVIGHPGHGPAALDHLGELFGREEGLAQRQRNAAVAGVARGVPLVTELTVPLVLVDFLAVFEQARLLRRGRGLRVRGRARSRKERRERSGCEREAATLRDRERRREVAPAQIVAGPVIARTHRAWTR